MDELDDLPPLPARRPAPPAVPLEHVVGALERLLPQLREALALAELPPIESMTPEERGLFVALREILERLDNAVKTRMLAIDVAFRAGLERMGAKELPIPGYTALLYTPAEGKWIVRADALLEEFHELVHAGVLTQEDIDKTFERVTTVKADNRVLNALARKRGKDVDDAIQRHREWQEATGQGRLTYPKRKEVPSDD